MLDYIANKDTSHEYLAYYRRAYKNVPLWVAVNAMTFGQTSKMLTALRDSEKAKIAKRFGVGNPKELSSFIRALALYRNVCAHGERLFSHRCHVEIPDTALHAKLGIDTSFVTTSSRHSRPSSSSALTDICHWMRVSARSASLRPWVSRPNGRR